MNSPDFFRILNSCSGLPFRFSKSLLASGEFVFEAKAEAKLLAGALHELHHLVDIVFIEQLVVVDFFFILAVAIGTFGEFLFGVLEPLDLGLDHGLVFLEHGDLIFVLLACRTPF